jgi:release factor glutamine methyltransferase
LIELPNAVGLGTDIDPQALEVARRNAARHDVSCRASWRLARSLERIEETFDVLVANPPYIRSDDLDGLEPEVRDYDPTAALDGGRDGLRVYREIAQDLARVVPTGWALFEVGMGQAEAVGEILARASSAFIETRQFRDLNGIARCVAWRARH